MLLSVENTTTTPIAIVGGVCGVILPLAVVTLLLWKRCKHKESVNTDAVGLNSGLMVEVTTRQVREEDDLPGNYGSFADNA